MGQCIPHRKTTQITESHSHGMYAHTHPNLCPLRGLWGGTSLISRLQGQGTQGPGSECWVMLGYHPVLTAPLLTSSKTTSFSETGVQKGGRVHPESGAGEAIPGLPVGCESLEASCCPEVQGRPGSLGHPFAPAQLLQGGHLGSSGVPWGSGRAGIVARPPHRAWCPQQNAGPPPGCPPQQSTGPSNRLPPSACCWSTHGASLFSEIGNGVSLPSSFCF